MTYPWAIVIVAGLAFLAYIIKLGVRELDEHLHRRAKERQRVAENALAAMRDAAFRESSLGKAMLGQAQVVNQAMIKIAGGRVPGSSSRRT